MKFNDLDLDKIQLYDKFIFAISKWSKEINYDQYIIFYYIWKFSNSKIMEKKEKFIENEYIISIEKKNKEITENILKLMENINDGFL